MDEKDLEKDVGSILWDLKKKKDNKWHRIDPDKIKTVKDIALLLDAINIKFQPTHPEFHLISHLLKEEKP